MQTINVKQLRQHARLSQEELAKVLGTSWVTVSRWERKVVEPNQEKAATLARFKELMKRIGKAIPAQGVVSFLTTPHPLLRGYAPADLLESDYSFEDLLDFVEAAKSGDMA
jgi:transcriptional regulator with XRE-family HTH domain